MTQKTHSLRNGIFCALVFLACYLVAWPVANTGFLDDFSYIKTAQVFAQTGHIAYNGWAAPILGWMIPWGALFIKLFGFSFMAVKLSTLPLAVGCVLLFHAILRRFEIGPRNAVIGTLTLGLSPLFLPLSASFMTDVPGLFVILLCLYCCQRAVAAGTDRAAIGWLVAAAVSNIVGGTARQIAWLGVLVMVPCTGWLLRQRRGVLAATGAAWLLGLGTIFWLRHWFAEQPYSVSVRLFPSVSYSAVEWLAHLLFWGDLLGALLLCLMLMVSPVLVVWLRRFGKKLDDYVALFCVGVVPLAMEALLLGKLAIVWPPHVLFQELSTRQNADLVWFRQMQHSMLPRPWQLVLSLFLIASLLGCLFAVRRGVSEGIRSADAPGARELVVLLVPFSAAYLALLIPLIPDGMFFDRYMLGLMPCAITASIWLYQRYVEDELPAVSVFVLVLFSAFAVAGTHDWFAWQRARLGAIRNLRRSGVSRTEIQAGIDYDGWTQVEDGGHITKTEVESAPANDRGQMSCMYWFLDRVPRLHPKYSVAVGPKSCYLPSKFPSAHYTAWLPPFHRTVEVQRVPHKTGGVGEVRR